jgi:hypothetical protein
MPGTKKMRKFLKCIIGNGDNHVEFQKHGNNENDTIEFCAHSSFVSKPKKTDTENKQIICWRSGC